MRKIPFFGSIVGNIVFGFIVIVLFASCSKLTSLDVQEDFDNAKVFDAFWDDVYKTYAFFDLDGVDWKKMYETNRSRVTENSSRHDMMLIMEDMLRPLTDGHISLKDESTGQSWSSERYGSRTENGSLSVVNRLLDGGFMFFQTEVNPVVRTKIDTLAYYGRYKNCLYYCIRTYNTKFDFANHIQSLATNFASGHKGLILDLRFNLGGEIFTMINTMGIFSSSPIRYAYGKEKLGPLPDQFGPFFYYEAKNQDGIYYDKPVVLLTSRLTFSAAEHSIMVAKLLPQFTIIGDTSGGAFSPVVTRKLPSHFLYRMANSKVFALDKVTCYEKVGITPDETILMTAQDRATGNDPMLIRAKEILNP